MKLRELPMWEKPREKLIRDGAVSLSNTELLAILLGTGSGEKSAMDLASEVLAMDQSQGLRHLAVCSPEELKTIDGIGEAKVCSLLAAVEIGRRISACRGEARGKIRTAEDIAMKYMEHMRYYHKEHFFCLLLDSKGGIIQKTDVSIGDINSAPANPREVFTEAIRRNASCVVFLHNHPSGDPTPSEEDLFITNRLAKAGDLLGIKVLDHIIIGDGTYISLREQNLM